MNKKTLIACLLSGVAFSAVAVTIFISSPVDSSLVDYPKNENGLTYGNAMYSEYGEEPDLISATATNGEKGYVYKTDLEEPIPNSPDEALAFTNEKLALINAQGYYKKIPVYLADGKTEIGVFLIGDGVAGPGIEPRDGQMPREVDQ